MSKPVVVVTRRWPEAVEARLGELFDAHLNAGDVPLDPDGLLNPGKVVRGPEAERPGMMAARKSRA